MHEQGRNKPRSNGVSNTTHSHRGISQLIGTLLMLAVVAGVGSVVLFQGITKINEFNFALAVFEDSNAESPKENLVIEHVRFTPTNTDMTIYVRNLGDSEYKITTITVVKLDTQELVLSDATLSTDIFPEELVTIQKTASLDPALATQWNDSDYKTSEYRISIITENGNVFEKLATPFNT